MRQSRVEREESGDRRQRDLGLKRDPAAVERVRDRAARDRQREQRDELAEGEQSDLQRRVGQLVELVRGGDGGDLGAEGRDRLAHEEAPERRIAPQRRRVER